MTVENTTRNHAMYSAHLKGKSQSDIAREEYIDRRTVHYIFKRYVALLEAYILKRDKGVQMSFTDKDKKFISKFIKRYEKFKV